MGANHSFHSFLEYDGVIVDSVLQGNIYIRGTGDPSLGSARIGSSAEEISKFFAQKIKDFGIGIPQEDKNKLFSSFYRASNTSTIQGSGLGLVVAKQFIELHNGEIEISSELNKGTVVTLKLPI